MIVLCNFFKAKSVYCNLKVLSGSVTMIFIKIDELITLQFPFGPQGGSTATDWMAEYVFIYYYLLTLCKLYNSLKYI